MCVCVRERECVSEREREREREKAIKRQYDIVIEEGELKLSEKNQHSIAAGWADASFWR